MPLSKFDCTSKDLLFNESTFVGSGCWGVNIFWGACNSAVKLPLFPPLDNSPETRARVKFVQDTSKYWYKPEISREQGELGDVTVGLGLHQKTSWTPAHHVCLEQELIPFYSRWWFQR